MSLDDTVFDDMFHGDGSVRVPGKCVQCAEETSDVEEDLCRTCLPDMHQSAVFGDSVGVSVFVVRTEWLKHSEIRCFKPFSAMWI